MFYQFGTPWYTFFVDCSPFTPLAQIWVFPKIVVSPKWMVKIMENPIKHGMIWGYHYFRKPPYLDQIRPSCSSHMPCNVLTASSKALRRLKGGVLQGRFFFYSKCVSKNRDTPKSSILIGFSIINHPFWGKHPYFWKHPYWNMMKPSILTHTFLLFFPFSAFFFLCQILGNIHTFGHFSAWLVFLLCLRCQTLSYYHSPRSTCLTFEGGANVEIPPRIGQSRRVFPPLSLIADF